MGRAGGRQFAIVIVVNGDVTSAARGQINAAVDVHKHNRVSWTGQVNGRLGVVLHHDGLHARCCAVVATSVCSGRRPGALDGVAPCADRVGHRISVGRAGGRQVAVVVVAHR